jgi:LacI family transcriptional regulator
VQAGGLQIHEPSARIGIWGHGRGSQHLSTATSMATASSKRLMVLFPSLDPEQAPVLNGIVEYARTRHKKWIIHVNPEMQALGIRHLVGWPGDGIIALLQTKAEVIAARAFPVPIVNLSGAIRDTGLPRVMADQAAIGRLAAEHLLARGFSRFGYFGLSDMWYSQQRKWGFTKRLKQAGYDCSVLESRIRFGRQKPWCQWMDLDAWLGKLKPPVGVMAVHDYRAAMVIDACARIGRSVPSDVAVIGVGNDVVTCQFAEVPLSSVQRNNQELGRQAAALLDRLMAGHSPPKKDILVSPEGVVERRSTDVLAVEDPEVAAVIRFIHEHLDTLCLSEALHDVVSISRRSLYHRFEKSLGRTPREYVWLARVECAKKLLASDEKPKLERVARACGFSGARHLRAVFHRVTGMTPKEYRRSGATL